MANVTMTLEEYEALLSRIAAMDPISMGLELARSGQTFPPTPPPAKKKRKKSAYNRRYAAAFKRVQGKYKKKSGGWMKDGFKRAQREAHRIARSRN